MADRGRKAKPVGNYLVQEKYDDVRKIGAPPLHTGMPGLPSLTHDYP